MHSKMPQTTPSYYSKQTGWKQRVVCIFETITKRLLWYFIFLVENTGYILSFVGAHENFPLKLKKKQYKKLPRKEDLVHR